MGRLENKKLAKGTGFFTKYKADGKWWLADPDGYAFFSAGPDCVNVPVDCRVDGIENGWIGCQMRKNRHMQKCFHQTAYLRIEKKCKDVLLCRCQFISCVW